MTGFSFRIRIHRSPENTINIDATRWEWNIGEKTPPLILCAQKKEEAIKDSETWVLKSDGWSSKEEACQAASKYIDALALTLVRMQIGADFGNRSPKSCFTHHGIAMLEAGSGRRVLNDVHGIMIYESEPPPLFASMGIKDLLGKPKEQFEKIFSHALKDNRILTERERLSLELFNASFFQKSNESRFILLVMAIEALLERPPRSSDAASHIESMILATDRSKQLSSEEKKSLLGSLKQLCYESINQTGRKLAEKCLRGRSYMSKEAPSFFTYCYRLRSQLTHGALDFPSQEELRSAVTPLAMFVSDILSGELREVS
jgi:hypothetical protein